jgi:hypothetical protein
MDPTLPLYWSLVLWTNYFGNAEQPAPGDPFGPGRWSWVGCVVADDLNPAPRSRSFTNCLEDTQVRSLLEWQHERMGDTVFNRAAQIVWALRSDRAMGRVYASCAVMGQFAKLDTPATPASGVGVRAHFPGMIEQMLRDVFGGQDTSVTTDSTRTSEPSQPGGATASSPTLIRCAAPGDVILPLRGHLIGGYTWTPTQPLPDGIVVRGPEYPAVTTPGLVGADQSVGLRVAVARPGTYLVGFQYKQSWMPGPPLKAQWFQILAG